MKNSIVGIIILLFLVSCTEKPKATVHVGENLVLPISCMKLNTIGVEKPFVKILRSLYTFDESCPYNLTISYKKDIVCNSSYNSLAKSTGKFPKSFLKFELRNGFDMTYSYYIDLFDNVESVDIEAGFNRLKHDILETR